MNSTDLLLGWPAPAADWNEAAPVGNGRMGAMVFGGTRRARIQINDSTVWSGTPGGPAKALADVVTAGAGPGRLAEAGFVAGNAPDAFQNSVQFFQAYASQHQLLPLDDHIAKDKFDMSRFSVGVSAWKFTDGKQYALPLDWAAAGLYYDQDALTKAGYSKSDIESVTWNPDDGGDFGKMIAHLTIDEKGRRGDERGFDKAHVKTFGFGQIAAKDFIGRTSWSPFASSTGWRLGDKESWPTVFNYGDPRLVKTLKWARSLTEKGYAPKIGEFTSSVSDVDLLSSHEVAMEIGGSWSASTFAKVPGVKTGIAAPPYGPDGKTRAVMSNSNGNTIWAGT